jgi:beta-D-xylosidase 4
MTQMQGNYADTAAYLINPLIAMQAHWSNVAYAYAADINSTSTSGSRKALSVASVADYIIYCGVHRY